MSNRSPGPTAGLLVVLAVLAVAGGLAFASGILSDAPLSDSDGGGSTATTDDAATEPAGSNAVRRDAATETRGADSRYDFAIERVESCGTTCRNVTARLTNEGSEPRENVRVTTVLYADGQRLWSGNETVGRLAAGETHTSTRRVRLGLGEAASIQGNDGYVTIVTLVRTDDTVVRFEDRRKVA